MWKGEGGKIEIVPVGAAWKATKANCRVFLTDLRDFLAVSLGDVLEKCATSRAFWLQLRVDRSLIILVSQICLLVSWEFHISVLWLCSWLLSSHLAKQFWSPKIWKRKKGSWSPLEFWAVLINWMNQYFSCNIRKEICSLITYQTLCQTVIAYFQNGSVKEKKKNNQKKQHGCRTTAQILTSQAEYWSIWLWRHCHVTFAFKCYLVSFKWSSCQIWRKLACVMLLCL